MKTINPKQIVNTERKWYVIDAEGQTLGRLATKVAVILRGKDRVDFAPHVDNGAYVIVLNAGKIKLTGNKEEDKVYHTHSQFMGGLKTTSVKTMREKKPTEIFRLAIQGMLPKTRLKDDMLARLKLQLWGTHKYEAQTPVTITL
ncbi:MAG: 50S ribosomal protein L13 [uncultured bacterium (gcode 4)]|uniref:Large ribosomal subunit protein uL13 n=1 Tax=uncultured bacterium (gcode 4) TaxID=1234023 RepID=K2GV88_9BACT|nr:MAG: 50S ribosomal protein L13 [uncultured bacterium (gcode 4)]